MTQTTALASRYTVLGSIAKGGMATVYLARSAGSAGFSRLVAIKRLHPELAVERDFVTMLVNEATLASGIRHANVAGTLDFVVDKGGLSLVMEYVEGDSLSSLVRVSRALGEDLPVPLVLAIVYGVLRGLDAAHEARSEDGEPLSIVHRDVSPQNVLVGVDGVPRLIDFGIAKAARRLEETRPGEIRGKFSYMAPEQMQGRPVTRQADVYAAGVVLWEMLAGKKLFGAQDPSAVCSAVLTATIAAPSTERACISPVLDAIVLRATARDLGERYLSAREMLADLEGLEKASDDEVGAWVRRVAARTLAERQLLVQGAAPPSSERPVTELIDDVVRGSSRDATDRMELATTRAPFVSDAPSPPSTPPNRAWASLVLLGALVAVVLMVGVKTLLRAPAHPPEVAAASAAPPLPDVVVASAPVAVVATAPSATESPPVASVASSLVAPRPARPLRRPSRAAASIDPRSYP